MSKLMDGLKMGGLRLEFVVFFSCVCNVHTVKRTRCKKSKKPAPGAKKQNLAPQVSLIKFKGHLPPVSMYDSHSLRERTEFLLWLFSRIFVKEISNVEWFGKRILFSPKRVNARASKNSWTAQVWKRKQGLEYKEQELLANFHLVVFFLSPCMHGEPSSWNAWHLASFLAKMPFSNREFFLLQILGTWLASFFFQKPCPYQYPEYSVKSTFLGFSRRWVDKNQSLIFLCLSNRQYVYCIYAHIWNRFFLFHYAPTPLAPFLYYFKRNRSFLRTFLTVKTILTFDIFAVVDSFMLSLLLSLLRIVAPHLSQNHFDIFPFPPYLLLSHSF